MKQTLKRVALIFILLGIIGVIFYQYLWGMLVYYSLQNHFAAQLAFQSFTITDTTNIPATNFTAASDPLVGDTLIVPIPFVEDPIKRTEHIVANDTQVIALYEPETRNVITRINDANETEVIMPKHGCAVLTRYFAVQDCNNNYELYRAYLDLDMNNLSFFSTARQQQVFYQLMLAKNATEPTPHITSFTTNNTKGFITPIQNNTYKVVVFTNDHTSYEMLFTGFAISEILATLEQAEVIES